MKDKKWVVWSNEHNAWWPQNKRGYLTCFQDAGRFSFEEAVSICSQANYPCGDYNEPKETMLPEDSFGQMNTEY